MRSAALLPESYFGPMRATSHVMSYRSDEGLALFAGSTVDSRQDHDPFLNPSTV